MDAQVDSQKAAQIFSKPLIIGASVSADYLSASPGKRLALRYAKPQDIHVIARHGRAGRDTVHLLHEKDVKERSVLIGMDLFFWDSTLDHPERSIKTLHHLVELVEKYRIPFILGDIPELLPGWQYSRKLIQDEIHRVCHQSPYCLLMPLEHVYKDVLREGGITYQNKQYELWDLVPDGLHIGDVAGNYLADIMLETLSPILNSDERGYESSPLANATS